MKQDLNLETELQASYENMEHANFYNKKVRITVSHGNAYSEISGIIVGESASYLRLEEVAITKSDYPMPRNRESIQINKDKIIIIE